MTYLTEDFNDIRKLMAEVEKDLSKYDALNTLHLERATSNFLTTLLNMGKFELVKKRI